MQQFYKQHQAKIWFEIIAISGIKTSQKKNKHYEWNTCWEQSMQSPYITIVFYFCNTVIES